MPKKDYWSAKRIEEFIKEPLCKRYRNGESPVKINLSNVLESAEEAPPEEAIRKAIEYMKDENFIEEGPEQIEMQEIILTHKGKGVLCSEESNYNSVSDWY